MQNEKEIISQIAAGKHSAFEYVYQQYYSPLLGFAKTIFPHEAEEIVQDAMLKLWENRAMVVEIQNLKGYLFQSVRNTCLNMIKHQDVVKKYESHAARELKILELQSLSEDTDNRKTDTLQKAIEEIPEQRRKIFWMSFVDNMRAKDIGEQFGISERTVHTHVYNAMKFLKSKLLSISIVGLMLNEVLKNI